MKLKRILSIALLTSIILLHPSLLLAEVDTTNEQEVLEEDILIETDSETTSLNEAAWVGTVKLTSGNLNVRKGPAIDEEIIGKLPNAQEVDVIEQYAEWAAISYNNSIGYVSLQYLTVALVNKPIVKSNNNLASKKVIVLDPGHGGKDPGAIAKDGTYESDLVWKYTIKTKDLLEKSGYIVHLTRSEKSSCTPYKKTHDELDCRVALAKKVSADIYISVHADANPSSKFRGSVTFYNDRDDLDGKKNPFPKESKLLAQSIHSAFQPVVGSNDRGVVNKNYYVNRMNSVPSILIELGVLTNSADLNILNKTNMQDKVSEALVKAVDQYFGYSSK